MIHDQAANAMIENEGLSSRLGLSQQTGMAGFSQKVASCPDHNLTLRRRYYLIIISDQNLFCIDNFCPACNIGTPEDFKKSALQYLAKHNHSIPAELRIERNGKILYRGNVSEEERERFTKK